MRRLAVGIASVAYTGFVPVAPGTVGSLVGLAVYAGLRWAGAPPAVDLAATIALLGLGVWAAGAAEPYFGLEDPGPIVIDEVVGMLVALLFTGVGWRGALVGFVLFRGLDIVKPYPAARVERIGGGWGIMADDVAAAIYANVALRLLGWLVPSWVS